MQVENARVVNDATQKQARKQRRFTRTRSRQFAATKGKARQRYVMLRRTSPRGRACIASNATSNSESTACVEQEDLPRLARREKTRVEKPCSLSFPTAVLTLTTLFFFVKERRGCERLAVASAASTGASLSLLSAATANCRVVCPQNR